MKNNMLLAVGNGGGGGSFPTGSSGAGGGNCKVQTVVDFSVLLTLANFNDNAELKAAGVDDLISNDDELQKAIAVMQEKERGEAIQNAAKVILELSKDSNRVIESLVTDLRDIRQAEKNVLAKMKFINRARAYGKATRNYLPLLRALGMQVSIAEAMSGKFTIPDDFKEEGVDTPATVKAVRARIKK